jgi:hypothetical protein
LVTGLKASAMSKWVWRLAPTPRPSAITSSGEESSHAWAMAPNAIWMPAALRPAMTVHTPICLPLVTREKLSATATAKRSSPIMRIGMPSSPRALFTGLVG